MNNISYSKDVSIENFNQIEVRIDPEYGVVWLYQNPSPRPCFNPELISEVRHVQHLLEIHEGKLPYKGELIPINYHVLDSHSPNMFSMGGDLDLFRDHVIRQDKVGLLKYAKSCIDTIHGFVTSFRLPVTTISLVRGDALGGGFEVAMSGNVVIAEKGIEMGFPEILFNLFPGMGGYQLLSQRLPASQVDKMMLNGKKYRSEELYDMGVVDVLADKGKGKAAVYSYINQNNNHRNGYLAMQRIHQMVHPISWESMMEVCAYWVDTAMNITQRDLRLMDRLVNAQDKAAAPYNNAAEKIMNFG